jgi:hypothetical protein
MYELLHTLEKSAVLFPQVRKRALSRTHRGVTQRGVGVGFTPGIAVVTAESDNKEMAPTLFPGLPT